MKKYTAKLKLKKLFERVQFHEKVIDEIRELVIGKGIEEQFINQLEKNLNILETFGLNAVQHGNFEKLKGCEDLFSMKFKGKNMNLRMLYSYDVFTEIIMLHFFYERDDSRKDSYEDHIPIALARKEEMKRYEK